MPDYAATVSKAGNFWMITIPELHALTQARTPGEIELMARALIAMHLDLPIEGITVTVAAR